MSLAKAATLQNKHMLAINEARNACRFSVEFTLGEFIKQCYFPHKEKRWKESSRSTTTDRIERHIVDTLGPTPVSKLTRSKMRALLDTKADQGLGKSMLDHLRFDRRDIIALAVADNVADRNPATALQTPRVAAQAEKRDLTAEQVVLGLSVLDQRERLVWKLAVLVGLRPGELLALQRRHIHPDHVEIESRIYKGVIDTPKSRRSKRRAAIPVKLGRELRQWLLLIDDNPDAWLFPSETGKTPVRPENLWRSTVAPRLKPLGLDWVNFQVLRRSQASLSHAQGVDPKVRADQLGHEIGVDLDEYTATSLMQKLEAVQTLENAVLH